MSGRKPKHNGVIPEVNIFLGDALTLYESWPTPTVIVSDGAYGLGGFPGDPPTQEGLREWYAPHVAAWSRLAIPQTTLWFWNSELGWATVHQLLIEHGWEYRNCHIWNKGAGHIAGNANSKTLRKFPVITEVCVQYVKKCEFIVNGTRMTMQNWLRQEWRRSGLPFYKANTACGVKNAATRKYLTACHLWYYPPVDAFERMVTYVNKHGDPEGRPYFSIDGKRPLTGDEWDRLRAKFYCEVGIHNVWNHPPVHGVERLKNGGPGCAHLNQKPLRLIETIIKASSDPGDVVWEPFGGLCTAAVASHRLGRRCYSAELIPEYFRLATARLGKGKTTHAKSRTARKSRADRMATLFTASARP